MSFRGKLWVLILSGVIAGYAVIGGLPAVGSLLTANAQQTVNDPNAQLKIVESVLDHIQNDYVDIPDMEKVRVGALRGLTSGLDPYSSYLTPEQAAEYTAGKADKTGIGAEFASVSGYLYVLSVTKGGPADKAGIKNGDVIEYIGSKATRDVQLYDAIHLIEGESGSVVTLRVLRSGEKPQTIKVTRGDAKPQAPETKLETGKTGVVKVFSLDKGQAERVREAVNSVIKQGAQKIVLDLRAVAGGSLEEGVKVANLFIGSGALATEVGKDNKITKTFSADPSQVMFEGKAALVTNINTSGAAEAIVAAFADHKRGAIVGERTFGAGSDQKFFPLSSGGGLLLTVAKWASPTGVPFFGEDRNSIGIKPSIEVKRGDTQDPDEVDTLLDKTAPQDPNQQVAPTPTPTPKPVVREDIQLKKAIEVLNSAG
ncbi:MAG: PDZ domain-containing protein [Acidobacteria bacterium]|nr:PDZ domain-containing protein [Acidobacteriota bacterium]